MFNGGSFRCYNCYYRYWVFAYNFYGRCGSSGFSRWREKQKIKYAPCNAKNALGHPLMNESKICSV